VAKTTQEKLAEARLKLSTFELDQDAKQETLVMLGTIPSKRKTLRGQID